MIKQELEKAKTLGPLTTDMQMMTNLQNIKQGLKSDLSDGKLARFILHDSEFSDLLVEEHLKKLAGTAKKTADAKKVKFLERDAGSFRKFRSQQASQMSPFNHFYVREAMNRGDPEAIY